MTAPAARFHGRTARKEQGPLPEGGSETYVYSFYQLLEGRNEGEGELIARLELTPAQYLEKGGRAGVELLVEQQRRGWAQLARQAHEPGAVIVVKTRGYRRSVWQVPMRTDGVTQ